jgi:two-component system nitrate/nitrite sensor histidine kinase NarX
VVRAKGDKIAGWKAAIESTIYPLATTPNLRHIYETGQPLIIPDVQQYPTWVDISANDWIRSHFCIPLQQGDAVIGFLSCESATPGFFSPNMLSRLQAFAHQTAIAITNAQLYQQGQELAVLQERQRLARDLHDAVTQTMFSASMTAETMLRILDNDPEQVRAGLIQLRHMTRGAVAEMRSLLYELRPEALESMTLPRLITQVVEAFGGKSGVIPSVTITGERDLPQDVKIALYRIVQEALNNVSKHARASAVSVSLRSDAVVELIVSDNGRGFTLEPNKSGSLGLKIMRERADKIDGRLTVQSVPGHGTTVRVEWMG